MGMWWFLASEVIIFGGLVVTYVLNRMAHPEWSEHAAHTVNWAGAANTVVLLTSSLAVVMAHRAAHDGEHAKAAKLLGVTLLLGLVFLGIKSFEYMHEIDAGYTPMTNLFWSFYFLMTGLHALHVIAGMVAMVFIALALRKGENPQRAEYVGMYWHLVDIVWIFLFPLLYLAS
jgi:heme/copper-type cytochrome/quinol oxidase subunit 3